VQEVAARQDERQQRGDKFSGKHNLIAAGAE